MRFDLTLDENLKKYTETVKYENQFYFEVDDQKNKFYPWISRYAEVKGPEIYKWAVFWAFYSL